MLHILTLWRNRLSMTWAGRGCSDVPISALPTELVDANARSEQ